MLAEILNAISRAKDELVDDKGYSRSPKRMPTTPAIERRSRSPRRNASKSRQIYERYERAKADHKARGLR